MFHYEKKNGRIALVRKEPPSLEQERVTAEDNTKVQVTNVTLRNDNAIERKGVLVKLNAKQINKIK